MKRSFSISGKKNSLGKKVKKCKITINKVLTAFRLLHELDIKLYVKVAKNGRFMCLVVL